MSATSNRTPCHLLGLSLKATVMAAVLAAVAPAHGQNFVLNGSFEDPVIAANTSAKLPAISDWSTPNVGGLLELWSGTFGAIPATDGNQHLELNGNLADQTVLQTVSVWPGFLTTFSFDYTGRPFEDNTFNVTITGDTSHLSYLSTALNPVSYHDSHVWDTFSTTFTPGLTDLTLTIAFQGLPDTHIAAGAHIDNVSLTAVPEPGEYAAVAGLALLAFGAWRRARL